jgi:hypothetical protein
MLIKKNPWSIFFSTVLAATLASGVARAWAADGLILKEVVEEEEAAGLGNYCHLKFPAIEPGTLGSAHPVLQNPDTGEIVDFYGPCDHDPLGADEVKNQIQDEVFVQSRDGE